ncbi:hypothetical protein ACFSR7_23650 [Cohnella sp. GCM10020058]|uniref:hypothetical protein n=1 Tax=Cohnella sp. GCM10020058 TaxID=3317330 RepID=UPI00363C7A8B
MAAYVDYKFKRGFILTEENIRKIHDILSKRFHEQNVPILYRVYREDSFSYVTSDVDSLINEDNNKGYRIVELVISVVKSDVENEDINFKLIFSKEGSRLKIEGYNRDFVFLLSSDIKEHYYNNIATSLVSSYKLLNFSLFRIVILITMCYLIYSFIIAPSTLVRTDSSGADAALHSKSIEEKLNFLITNTTLEYALKTFNLSRLWPLLLLPLVIILDLSGTPKYLIKSLFPTNIFHIGREKDYQEKLGKLKGNILWGVIIAFVIGAAASFLVWKLTLPG